MQGKLKGTRPNNQQFLHEFAKNLPVNSKENFTVQDWVYFIESALWTRQLFVHFLVLWPYGNLWLKVLLWSLTEKRQNWITINKRWKCGAGQEMSKSSWKFMKGDNTPLLQVLQGLKIAAISFRNPLFSPLITSVNSVPFQPLPHNRDFCMAGLHPFSLAYDLDISRWNVISGRSVFRLSSLNVHVRTVVKLAKFLVLFCSIRCLLNCHDFFACSFPFARNSFPKDVYKSMKRLKYKIRTRRPTSAFISRQANKKLQVQSVAVSQRMSITIKCFSCQNISFAHDDYIKHVKIASVLLQLIKPCPWQLLRKYLSASWMSKLLLSLRFNIYF